MKKIIISAAAATLFATSAFAGSMVEPEMEPMVEVMEEPASSSDGGLLVPILALIAIGLLVSNSSDDSEPEPEVQIPD